MNSEIEFIECKYLMTKRGRDLAHLFIDSFPVTTACRNIVVLPGINELNLSYESLNSCEELEFLIEKEPRQLVEDEECDECSLLLPEGNSPRAKAFAQQDYDSATDVKSSVVEKHEETVFDFNNIEDDEQKAVFVRSVGTETNELLFPQNSFVVQHEKVLVTNSSDCSCYFHPNSQKVMAAMKAYLDGVIEAKKSQIIADYLKSVQFVDSATEYGECELFDDQATLCGQEDETDNATLVLDPEDQTPYVPRQVTFLPMAFPPISTTLSLRMPTPFESWECSHEISHAEILEIEEDGYEWVDEVSEEIVVQ
jgi:hypothetical protein